MKFRLYLSEEQFKAFKVSVEELRFSGHVIDILKDEPIHGPNSHELLIEAEADDMFWIGIKTGWTMHQNSMP